MSEHTKDDTDRLLPCPFCGGTAEFEMAEEDEDDPHNTTLARDSAAR